MGLEEVKIPPQSLEIERAVLGAILIERNALIEVIDILEPDCFYSTQHRSIFEKAIKPMFLKNESIDLLTVSEKLRSQNLIDDQLNAHFIAQLTTQIASAVNIKYHALILKQFAIKRNLIKYSYNILQKAYSNDSDSLKLIDSAGRELDQIANHVSKKPFSTIDEVIQEGIKEIEMAENSSKNLLGVPSGFIDLDNITAGWQKSDLIILAARPGMGKTTLAINCAENAAINHNVKTAIFSLEMSKVQLGMRTMASQSRIQLKKLKLGELNSLDWTRLHSHIEGLKKAGIFIDDTGAITILEFKTKARRLKHEHPDLGLIVIDYLQLMNGNDPNNRSQNREQEVSYISRSLKAIAKELDVPIIALSQLSRSVEARGGDKRPQLSDLRESGAIEQDADMVIFIYRPDYYGITEDANGNDIGGQAEIRIAKHRNGGLGQIKLGFYPERCKFISIQDFLINQTMFEPPRNFYEANNEDEFD